MKYLLKLKYNLNKDLILKESENAKKISKYHTDNRYPDKVFTDWKVSTYESDYTKQIMKDFDVQGVIRFYWLKPYAHIKTHTDNSTKCSLNFLLSDNNTAITINNINYFYKYALLDTTQPHSVKNGEKERLLFKISIQNENFLQVANKIMSKGYYEQI